MLKKVLGPIAVAAVVFLGVGFPTGVIEMIDMRYCFEHERRPHNTSFHEETLSFLPPGPECRFTLENGREVIAGPGWWPAISLAIALLASVLVLRLSSARQAGAAR